MALVQWSCNGICEIGYKVFDEKASKLAQDEAIAIVMEIKTSKMLRSELVALEFWVRRSVGQTNVDRVGLFIIVLLFTIPTMLLQLSFWVLWLSNYCVFP
jgi:hypothetical protein